MSELRSAKRAKDFAIKCSPEVSLNEALVWLDGLIEVTCLNGGLSLSMDIQTWHEGTYGEGSKVRQALRWEGYTYHEQEYINIIDGFERKEKKVIISW